MKSASIALVMTVGFAIVAQIQALSCYTCSNTDCKNSLTPTNCTPPNDVCFKLDLGNNVTKTCGSQSWCTEQGFKSSNPSMYSNVKTLFGAAFVDGLLATNKNVNGAAVINCCKDKDNCNSGAHKTLSLVAVLMMVISYVLV